MIAAREVIIVDDGSTDETADVAAGYDWVRYLWKPNGGLSSARNAGLAASTGDYIVFLDADDILLPGGLQAGLDCVTPTIGFVYGGYHVADEHLSTIWEIAPRPVEDEYEALLTGNHIGMHGAVMYRRAALNAVGGFNPALDSCEDLDVYLRIARKHPVRSHQHAVAAYRRHGSNMSSNNARMLSLTLRVLTAQQSGGLTGKQRAALSEGIYNAQRYYLPLLWKQLIPQMRTARGARILLRMLGQCAAWSPTTARVALRRQLSKFKKA